MKTAYQSTVGVYVEAETLTDGIIIGDRVSAFTDVYFPNARTWPGFHPLCRMLNDQLSATYGKFIQRK